jgi:hypothetical protein
LKLCVLKLASANFDVQLRRQRGARLPRGSAPLLGCGEFLPDRLQLARV